MSATLQQIDLLRERANVSYQDAKDALESCNYQIVDALVYLEKENKLKFKQKKKECEGKFIAKVKEIVRKGNKTRFIIQKNQADVVNLSVTTTVVIGVIATPVVVFGIPAALITNHKIKIEKENGEDVNVNKIFDKVSTAVNSMTDKLNTTDEQKVDITK
ncbi:MAG: DUF4342 domain-containing protein [Bacillota bacterium]